MHNWCNHTAQENDLMDWGFPQKQTRKKLPGKRQDGAWITCKEDASAELNLKSRALSPFFSRGRSGANDWSGPCDSKVGVATGGLICWALAALQCGQPSLDSVF